MMKHDHVMGFTGRFSEYFITSKVTPLIMIMTLVIGILSIWVTPKEDEPSIILTVADVLFVYPGRGAQDIDEHLARPVGSWIREIPDVKHVVSSASENAVIFTVEFRDRVPREKALTQLYDKIIANMDQLPPGVSTPMIKPRGVAEVPSLAVNLWSEDEGPEILRKIAAEMATELRRIPNVSRVDIIGGQTRSFLVELDARRLAERGIAADKVVQAIQAANIRMPAGSISGDKVLDIEAGSFLQSAADTGSIIVGSNAAGPIYLQDVANVRDGFTEPSNYVSRMGRDTGWSAYPAVTLAITKVDRTNVTAVTRETRVELERLAKELLPANIHLSVIRDTGERAERTIAVVNSHLAITIIVAICLVYFTLEWRSGLITALTLVVTALFVPIVYYLTGYTLNRITLSSIVFSIGLLIDNAIVVIENIYRHWHGSDDHVPLTAAYAVQEVGPPTSLATLMVVCALIPSAFVTGMVGQYARALPVGAVLGMIFSLFIAFTVTPYLCMKLFSSASFRKSRSSHEAGKDHMSKPIALYLRTLSWIMDKRMRMCGVYALSIFLLVMMVAMIPARIAILRVMPYDNVDEVSVMVDLPPETPLEDTYARVMEAAEKLKQIPEVVACNVFVGNPAPVTFQGLARHYDFRKSPFQAEIQIQLLPNNQRHRRSHEIALDIRPLISPVLSDKDTVVVVAERPPAVPTFSPLVAEIYGPDDKTRLDLAREVKHIFSTMPGVEDVDWTARPGTDIIRYDVDPQKASIRGVIAAQAALTVRTLFAGDTNSWANLPNEREPVPFTVRLVRAQRSSIADLNSLTFTPLMGGTPVPATEIGSLKNVAGPYPLLRKDQQPVVMVTGVVTGYGPVYSGEDISKILKDRIVGGQSIQVIWNDNKPQTGRYAVSWAGEWTVQRDMFSDLGVAFLVVLFLIYCILVAWYRSFLLPIVIMLPIPLIFIGIIPAHVALGQTIDGVGAYGMIALAGIVIRNSILLVDFARERIASGMPVKEAVLEACEKRVRPIILTALAVILGEAVLFFDPVLMGLGTTMPSGAFVSTLLSLGIVPLAFYQLTTFLHSVKHGLVTEREPERV
jgi:multidrug efflux pump subunit AcrB